MNMKNALLAAPAALVASPVFAAGVDYTSLTSSVDFATVITAILAVMAAIAGVGVAFKGGKLVLRALGIS